MRAWRPLIALALAAALAAPARAESADRPRPQKRNAALAVGAIYVGLYGYTTLAWYLRDDESPTFLWKEEGWFGHDSYAGGADKLGHLWANYALTRGVTRILRDGGWSRRGSLLAASGLSLAFFTMSEIHDGYHQGYGFSINDMYANVAGVLIGNLLEASPALDRRISLRLQYFPSMEFMENVAANGPFNSPEDYTGQTFLLSYHLPWARYLDLSLGYEAIGYLPRRYANPTQNLFVGLSLNAQAILDQASDPPTNMRGLAAEIYAPPLAVMRPSASYPFAEPQP